MRKIVLLILCITTILYLKEPESTYETLSVEDLKYQRFVSELSTQTEIILLEEVGSSSITYSYNPKIKFLSSSSIDICTHYKAIITIPTNKLKFKNEDGKVVIVYNTEDFKVKSIEITDKQIQRYKQLLGHNFTDEELVTLELSLTNNIRNDIMSDTDTLQQAEDSLVDYLLDISNKFNVTVKIN